MTDKNTERITGKQVLGDAVTLLRDTGALIYELGKTVIVKIKSMIATANADADKDNNG